MSHNQNISGSWQGRGLLIDLASQQIRVFEIPREWADAYLGGTGLGARILYAPGNQDDMVMAPGLLLGLPIYTASKLGICAVSPLTGRWGESNVGGDLGIAIKNAGYDLLWFKGGSPKWTVVRITDSQVEFEPADDLLGLSPEATEKVLGGKWGTGYRFGAIGPAAENGVRFASIRCGERIAGRCGMGLDWARRKIKVVGVAGSLKLNMLDPESLKAGNRELLRKIRVKAEAQSKYGTACGVVYREGIGDLPVRNFAKGTFPAAQKISGQAMVERFHGRRRACPHCPIACAKEITVPEINYRGPMPEYETVAALGSLLMIEDPVAVIAGNRACNEYGMDTISMGSVAAFALECFERGLLTRADFGAITPEWGSGKCLLELIDATAKREGIGELLAQGTRQAALKIGKGALDFAVQSHGLELAMHDPRAFVSLAVSYSIGTRGGSHNEAMSYFVEQGFDMADFGFPGGLPPHEVPGKGKMTAVMQDLSTVYDNLGLCKFLYSSDVGPATLLAWIRAGLGWGMTRDELQKCGERSYTLKHLFNIDRLGIKPSADLPKRVLSEIRGEGGSANILPDLPTMLREYYEFRGWSRDGYPPDHARPADLQRSI